MVKVLVAHFELLVSVFDEVVEVEALEVASLVKVLKVD